MRNLVVEDVIHWDIRFYVQLSPYQGGSPLSYRGDDRNHIFETRYGYKNDVKQIAYEEPLLFRYLN